MLKSLTQLTTIMQILKIIITAFVHIQAYHHVHTLSGILNQTYSLPQQALISLGYCQEFFLLHSLWLLIQSSVGMCMLLKILLLKTMHIATTLTRASSLIHFVIHTPNIELPRHTYLYHSLIKIIQENNNNFGLWRRPTWIKCLFILPSIPCPHDKRYEGEDLLPPFESRHFRYKKPIIQTTTNIIPRVPYP
jgi:hypothetical protein